MLSILLLACLVACVVAGLATAITSALGKKAVIPLALYGVAVLLILGAELALSNSEPVPSKAVGSRTADIIASFPQQLAAPPSSASLAQQQNDAVPEENADQDEVLSAEEDVESVAESLVESELNSTPAASTPPKTSSKKIESMAEPVAVPVYDDAIFTVPTAPDPVVNAEPMLAENISTSSDRGPTLAGEPALTPMSNPTLTGEPEPNDLTGPALSNSGNPSSDTYSHDFSSGRLLVSRESDKYHCKDCIAAQNILPENEVWFSSAEDAAAHGYEPCGICYR